MRTWYETECPSCTSINWTSNDRVDVIQCHSCNTLFHLDGSYFDEIEYRDEFYEVRGKAAPQVSKNKVLVTEEDSEFPNIRVFCGVSNGDRGHVTITETHQGIEIINIECYSDLILNSLIQYLIETQKQGYIRMPAEFDYNIDVPFKFKAFKEYII